jgi:hypothetical protein
MDNVHKWLEIDKKLSNKLVEIQNSTNDKLKQAEMAFWEISEMYNLPKLPGDNEEAKAYCTVYEQLAFLNFLEPDVDLRGHVLSAIFYVKNDFIIDINDVFQKQFGNSDSLKILTGIGYREFSVDVKPIFVMKDENWLDKGCKYFTKPIDKSKR